MNGSSAQKIWLSLVFVVFSLYAFRLLPVQWHLPLPPADDPPQVSFVKMALGQGAGANPAVFSVFNLLGVIPLLYWAVLFPDGRGQRVWVWPFALGMMALGSFSLLPYLILRRPFQKPVSTKPNLAVRWFGSRGFAWFADGALLFLLVFGLVRGDWAGYAHWFHISGTVHVMTLDLVVLTLLFPVVIWDDLARRGVSRASILGRIALFVPLLGPAYYLAVRPPEPATLS